MQVNDTSVVNNGVVNIPVASQTDFGVVKLYPTYGIGASANGFLYIVSATSNLIQAGTVDNRAVTANAEDSILSSILISA